MRMIFFSFIYSGVRRKNKIIIKGWRKESEKKNYFIACKDFNWNQTCYVDIKYI